MKPDPTPPPPLFVHRFSNGRCEQLALHGFSLDGRMYSTLAGELPGLWAADLPGHGQSAQHTTDWGAACAAVAATLEVTGARKLLGYSQGGRLALQVALDRPDLVDSLVLVSAGVGIADDAKRAARAEADAALADSIEAGGIEAFVSEWLARPLVRPSLEPAAAAADRALRLSQSTAGLAAALRGMGQGAMPYLGARLGELTCEVLWIAGERDPRYSALAQQSAERGLRGTFCLLPAGHNVVAEQPLALAAAIRGDR